MTAPIVPPTTAPMMAPLTVEPVWFPITPPTTPPAAAPMTAPSSLRLSEAQAVTVTASKRASTERPPRPAAELFNSCIRPSIGGTDKSVATVCALVHQPRIASGWYDARVGSDDPASLDHANQEDDDGDDE